MAAAGHFGSMARASVRAKSVSAAIRAAGLLVIEILCAKWQCVFTYLLTSLSSVRGGMRVFK